MKRIVILLLSIFCSITVFYSSTLSKVKAENINKLANVESLNIIDNLKDIFCASLVVKANTTAGLKADINIDLDLVTRKGTLYLPSGVDSSKLYLTWKGKLSLVNSEGTVYESGQAPIALNGKTVTYYIRANNFTSNISISIKTLVGSKDVEAMFLEIDESLGTIAEMESNKDNSCYGSISFDGDEYENISIKGRGNVTWNRVKKPYNITFYKNSDYSKKQKVSLIDGVQAKKWTLLANYDDPTQLRNKVAYNLASKLGIGLDSRYVDLYINGEYQGLYLLTPKNDYQASDDGFILECDNYICDEDEYQFNLPNVKEGLFDGQLNRMTIKDIGDNATSNGVTNETIKNYFLEAWEALCDYESNDYLKYFDIDSWAKMYLMFEVTKVYDADSGSIFMHRDGMGEDDLIIAGPAWDYDKCFGWIFIKPGEGMPLKDQLSAEGWYIDSVGTLSNEQSLYLLQEFGKHADFRQRLQEIYNEYKWAFDEILEDIDIQNNLIEDSVTMDDNLYGQLHSAYFSIAVPTRIGCGKYQISYQITDNRQAKVNNMRGFTAKRLLWIDDQLKNKNKENISVEQKEENIIFVEEEIIELPTITKKEEVNNKVIVEAVPQKEINVVKTKRVVKNINKILFKTIMHH